MCFIAFQCSICRGVEEWFDKYSTGKSDRHERITVHFSPTQVLVCHAGASLYAG